MVYVFLADGFEEIEAICPTDILRRANVLVQTVGVPGKTVTGSHGIPVTADLSISEIKLDDALEMIVLPGGMPGTDNLQKDPGVNNALDFAAQNDIYIAAICAAPKILGAKGLLNGKKATCFPGYEEELKGAEIVDKSVVTNGKIITAKGAGAALLFGFELTKALKGQETAEKIARVMQTP
ncbi:MAG: DJ-1/PfpI family protein [Ruminococcus sp.]|jgi:4-methyl-5(b-hydroxyethyl)-thiazole monophosphate biosynthesis|nr:DJ-1/PfpI family protein [Ruminococcus sp.]